MTELHQFSSSTSSLHTPNMYFIIITCMCNLMDGFLAGILTEYDLLMGKLLVKVA